MEKRQYIVPEIDVVILDMHISLQMQSNPADGPGESISYNNENGKQTPWKVIA